MTCIPSLGNFCKKLRGEWDLNRWLTGVRDFPVHQSLFIGGFQVLFILLPEYISNSSLCSPTVLSALRHHHLFLGLCNCLLTSLSNSSPPLQSVLTLLWKWFSKTVWFGHSPCSNLPLLPSALRIANVSQPCHLASALFSPAELISHSSQPPPSHHIFPTMLLPMLHVPFCFQTLPGSPTTRFSPLTSVLVNS